MLRSTRKGRPESPAPPHHVPSAPICSSQPVQRGCRSPTHYSSPSLVRLRLPPAWLRQAQARTTTSPVRATLIHRGCCRCKLAGRAHRGVAAHGQARCGPSGPWEVRAGCPCSVHPTRKQGHRVGVLMVEHKRIDETNSVEELYVGALLL